MPRHPLDWRGGSQTSAHESSTAQSWKPGTVSGVPRVIPAGLQESSRRHDVVYSLPNDRRSVNSRCRVSFYMSPRARVEAVAPSALLFIDKFAFHHHAAEFPQIFADTWRFFISSVITLLASLPRSGPAGGNNSCWGFRVPQKPHLISALQGLLSPKSRKTLLHSRQERTI
ncbi:uncharacterized protein LOC125090015 isoform X3 [Lutra lutra]|uniref:uncharacterized protein LOC125090015 isoform X3 n=1 Tax=Lutra lutra TaxID=9657 RepID=UPI001FD5B52E|nr:uncharacterized protein LOC125090015 isoform X3 [Lutra lutra]XP_047568520.1 uncharacterized protein LOC125090015 isoform X3 [Lutra lutra]XP_047568521.1 uncharacterized protein LOC125090015 isoform X3 [Lutra lutra]XP_047568522.1 uncharacterized protein LOC125090015 isoform X3 [Lutra lutra]